jgi:hypothetical protein
MKVNNTLLVHLITTTLFLLGFLFLLLKLEEKVDNNSKSSKKEYEKIKELQNQMTNLRSAELVYQTSIDSLKKIVLINEYKYNINLQQIKNLKNVQNRNVSDSSYNAILSILQPK